ncbi:MAG: TraR/DksA C4-type zinc finger protein [Candidatus Taylorbacteria bacterium]|nr:TraR/DksA C4-type zinc finger protein [Candidatus Taylorbacteria bacterium]
MKSKDITYFKDRLIKEKATLEEELKSVGRINPENPSDWEATVDDSDVDSADENEVADKMEELVEHKAILTQLEKQLGEVHNALERIEQGKYGICEVSGEEIERERLEANPSARTSIKHLRDLEGLKKN